MFCRQIHLSRCKTWQSDHCLELGMWLRIFYGRPALNPCFHQKEFGSRLLRNKGAQNIDKALIYRQNGHSAQ